MSDRVISNSFVILGVPLKNERRKLLLMYYDKIKISDFSNCLTVNAVIAVKYIN